MVVPRVVMARTVRYRLVAGRRARMQTAITRCPDYPLKLRRGRHDRTQRNFPTRTKPSNYCAVPTAQVKEAINLAQTDDGLCRSMMFLIYYLRAMPHKHA
jgi:hypothetical protein